ncbi:MAG TPA: TatD family hydrolase [Pseudomonadales bacterium]|nr:TatD family hydrolase [Pseudomonadales bacterium]
MFLDSHCHLDKLKLDPWNGELASALADARERGVQRFLCIGIGLDNLDRVMGIAESFPDVFASVGIHPSEFGGSEHHPAHPGLAGHFDDVMLRLEELARHPKVLAIGETGLDFYHEGHDLPMVRRNQLESFEAHLGLAKSLALPVVVHTRAARQETIAAIRACASPTAGVLHCFTEDWEMARQALDLGYYISISGIVTFRNADNVRDVARRVPSDRLLVETDSPWLAPVPHRGKSNQPGYVVDVYHYLAELRSGSVEGLADSVWNNFHKLFRKIASNPAA